MNHSNQIVNLDFQDIMEEEDQLPYSFEGNPYKYFFNNLFIKLLFFGNQFKEIKHPKIIPSLFKKAIGLLLQF